MLAFTEMYVQGVSTRKVTTIVEKMCGVSVSFTQVSRSTKKPEKVLEVWRNSTLGICDGLVQHWAAGFSTQAGFVYAQATAPAIG